MSITYHERPGVYSDYDASSISASGNSLCVIALAGTSAAEAGLYTVTSYASAKQTFGESSQLGKMLKLAYDNGAGTVLAYSVENDTKSDYEAAFAAIFAEKTARFCAVGSSREDVQTALKTAVEAASEQKGECIGIAGMEEHTVTALTTRAATLNSERMVLVGPEAYLEGESDAAACSLAAAALAGVLSNQADPALPLNGQVLADLSGVAAVYSDTEIDMLVQGGVTILECIGGEVSVMRGITTRTKTGGAVDKTYRELNTVLILDDVIPSIREALRSKFSRAKNNAVTRNAIRNQVIVELEDRVDREVIESYSDLSVTADATDPTTCVVEFAFTVVHGLNRIYLSAHISV